MHAPGAENLFDYGSFGLRKLSARDTKFGTWVHLGKAYLAQAYLAPYEEGVRVHCARAVHVQTFGPAVPLPPLQVKR